MLICAHTVITRKYAHEISTHGTYARVHTHTHVAIIARSQTKMFSRNNISTYIYLHLHSNMLCFDIYIIHICIVRYRQHAFIYYGFMKIYIYTDIHAAHTHTHKCVSNEISTHLHITRARTRNILEAHFLGKQSCQMPGGEDAGQGTMTRGTHWAPLEMSIKAFIHKLCIYTPGVHSRTLRLKHV